MHVYAVCVDNKDKEAIDLRGNCGERHWKDCRRKGKEGNDAFIF